MAKSAPRSAGRRAKRDIRLTTLDTIRTRMILPILSASPTTNRGRRRAAPCATSLIISFLDDVADDPPARGAPRIGFVEQAPGHRKIHATAEIAGLVPASRSSSSIGCHLLDGTVTRFHSSSSMTLADQQLVLRFIPESTKSEKRSPSGRGETGHRLTTLDTIRTRMILPILCLAGVSLIISFLATWLMIHGSASWTSQGIGRSTPPQSRSAVAWRSSQESSFRYSLRGSSSHWPIPQRDSTASDNTPRRTAIRSQNIASSELAPSLLQGRTSMGFSNNSLLRLGWLAQS